MFPLADSYPSLLLALPAALRYNTDILSAQGVSGMSISDETRKMMFIINPVSGKKMIIRYLPDVIRIFMDAGYLVTAMVTSRRGEAAELASRYCEEYDLVVCAGGDGTLNEIVTGLARANSSLPVGYIPCGSTNDFAVSRGLSSEILTAASKAVSGQVACYDIGQFENRFFTYIAAFGAFASVSYNTDQNLKNTFGRTAYIMSGLLELSAIQPIHLRFTVDGTVIEDNFAFGAVCNTTSIGGTLTLPSSRIDPSDGFLELLLVRMPNDLIDLDEIVHGLFEQDYSSPLLEFIPAKNILVESIDPIEWSLDGEAGGAYTSIRISSMPGFLRLNH